MNYNENPDFKFLAVKKAIYSYAKVTGMLGGSESELLRLEQYKTHAKDKLYDELGKIGHYIFNDLSEYQLLLDKEHNLNKFVFNLIDYVDAKVEDTSFDDILLPRMTGHIEQALVWSSDDYSLTLNNKEVLQIPLKSGLTLIVGDWQSGKSTFMDCCNIKYRSNMQTHLYGYTVKKKQVKTGNAKSNTKEVTVYHGHIINNDVDYTSINVHEFDKYYVSEPDYQSLNFNLYKVCRHTERDPRPLIIDSVSKAEYYIKTLGLEKGISSAMMVVADNLNFYAHRKPIVMIGWTEIQNVRLIGGISNVIRIEKTKSGVREVRHYRRGLMDSPDVYKFRKNN